MECLNVWATSNGGATMDFAFITQNAAIETTIVSITVTNWIVVNANDIAPFWFYVLVVC